MKFPFVGRKRELEGLKRLNSGAAALPVVVYGPEGCGKTTLFREAVGRLQGWFGDGRAVYVNALAEGLDKALAVSGGASAELVADVVAALSRFFPGMASEAAA